MSSQGFSSGAPGPRPGPKIIGRPQRLERKNPFVGLKGLKYSDIKDQCRQGDFLFEDPEFPADNTSIFFKNPPPKPLEWRRPHKIGKDPPKWISAGASRFDVCQGELGDCWLIAAVASLTFSEQLFQKVVPPEQSFTDDYRGVFKFNFWHQGEWQEVVVDDRLPTDKDGQLVYMHSTEKNEFWSALLEKAYAKLSGSYEALDGGKTSEAMEDFTGGVPEMFELRGKEPRNLISILLKAHERGSLMGCSIYGHPNQTEQKLENGLIMGHSYSITKVALLNIKTSRGQELRPMVRVRNPWGNECEWKGAWSDGSHEWNLISVEEKQKLGLNKAEDGEFWMTYEDFCREFQKLEICNLGPDSLEEENLTNKKRWEMTKERGAWVRRINAGGCRNYQESFWTNPQYRMTLTDPDEDDNDKLCTTIIALLQKDRRKKRKEGLDLLSIGYDIYKLPDMYANGGPLDMTFFKSNGPVAQFSPFSNTREVCGRYKLRPGTYCIVPSTFEPHQEGDFLVRIFSEKPNTSGKIDEQTSYVDKGAGMFRVVHPICCGPKEPTADEEPHQQQRRELTLEEKDQKNSLKEKFKLLAGKDMEIDAYDLQGVLNSVFQKAFTFLGFTIDITRSMVAMYDGDLSGKLGYDEFKALWEDLLRWKDVFKQFDRDGSGSLNSFELRAALNHVGFRLSNLSLQSLVMRYSDRQGKIDIGDFIACAVRLKTMLTSFRGHDPENRGVAPYDIESFIQTTLYS